MSTRLGALRGIAAAAAVALLVAPAVPAAAATSSEGNWWWDTYGVQALHDAGATGAGVKIGVMDELIDPTLPVFAGRNLRVADETMCEETSTAVASTPSEGSVHGTSVTALIIGSGEGAGAVRGIAPDAEVTFYGLGREDSGVACTFRDADQQRDLTALGYGVQRALADGVDIFTTSISSGETTPEDGDVIAEALAAGMIIVDSTYNPSASGTLGAYDGGRTNGVILASAVDSAGDLQKLADGQPLALAGTRVVAAGVRVASIGRAGGTWDESGTSSGSSNAAPLVAGMMALAAQQHPDATSNQLIQSLIHTTNGVKTDDPVPDSATGYGYGAAWPATMLADDPTAYPDENPLMDRADGFPTTEQLSAAVAARVSSDAPDETASPDDSSEAASPNPLLPSVGSILAIVLGILGAVVVAAVVTVIIVVTARKRRSSQGGRA